MENIKPPAEFVPYNGEKKWETWREAFEIFSIAADLESMPLVRQRAILKHILGEKTVSIYKTFRVTENEAYPSIKEMLDMFSKHFKPFKNIIQIRNKFFTSVQKEGQGITEFVTELKQLAQECEFEELAESLIRDRFIIGMIDQEVKKKLLEDPQLTLPKAISVATIAESVCVQIASWEEKQAMIEKINKNTWEKNRSRVEKAKAGPSIASTRNECKWCGQQHRYGNCPAYRKTCNACGKLNHFAAVCRTRRIRNLIAENEGDESFEGGINVNKVLVKTVRSDKWSAVISINGNKTSVHLDTGAQINVLPQKVISLWPAKPIIKPTSLKAYAYGHSELPIVGKCEVLCQYGEKKWETWREAFEIFSIAADLESMPLVRQRAILKHILGEKTVSIYKTFRVTENEAYPSIKEMLDMFSKWQISMKRIPSKSWNFVPSTFASIFLRREERLCRRIVVYRYIVILEGSFGFDTVVGSWSQSLKM
ncbi:K02A2.6-like [Cordylochernes scorpioides]|uniref:K02A2.6-like n=1 Tax=Cordylochernes scorpioides TaxID=51811 RepID=A0ABY6LTR8_9ARAC|nr:K02A2.6-like [Cordylochernes scorpioides]